MQTFDANPSTLRLPQAPEQSEGLRRGVLRSHQLAGNRGAVCGGERGAWQGGALRDASMGFTCESSPLHPSDQHGDVCTAPERLRPFTRTRPTIRHVLGQPRVERAAGRRAGHLVQSPAVRGAPAQPLNHTSQSQEWEVWGDDPGSNYGEKDAWPNIT